MKVVKKEPHATFTQIKMFFIIFLVLQALVRHMLKFLLKSLSHFMS